MGFLAYLKGEQPGIITSLLNYKNPGQYGEYLTEYALNHNNLEGYLKTIQNAYIPHKGQTTEIDLIMLHEKGIFVFESKNYGGWIFGSADQQQWTQTMNSISKKQFYNPILQNKTHINALSAYLHIPVERFSSYIVFSERCELKKIPDDTPSFTILKRDRLLRILREDLDVRPIVHTYKDVDAMAVKLAATRNVDQEAKQQHIENISMRTTGDTCPFCGNALVLRNSQYGEFFGCSKYPRCRYKRKTGG